MTVSVKLFAILRERAGCGEVEIDLPAEATVADAIEALGRRPGLEDVMARMPMAMAVNRQYADATTALAAGDELALIPPVSGGAPATDAIHARVTSDPLQLQTLADAVVRPGAGAVVSFQGITREVERLDYEAYEEMAGERIETILVDCLTRHGLEAAAAEHRVGSVPLGAPSVIVAVSAAHREAAFAGAREAIDRIKAEAPIWKREVQGGTGEWVEGTRPT